MTKLKSDRSHVERDEKDSDSNVDEECYRIFQVIDIINNFFFVINITYETFLN